MSDAFSRTKMLIGSDNFEKLKKSKVIVFGVGGVGGYVVEALARSGIERIDICDNDVISESNINRQIVALNSTIGMLKVDVIKKRILDINPNILCNTYPIFVGEDNIDSFDFANYDYIIDAIDTVSAKLLIITKAKESSVKIISSMGTGNKLDPLKFMLSDINQTSVCPLAKVMRYELRKKGINHLKCLYSKEVPVKLENKIIDDKNNKSIPASIAYMPSVAGLIIAQEVIKDLLL